MVDVLMVFATVLLDTWEKLVSKKCAPMVALVMGDATVLPESVNAMLAMVVLIALNQFAQTVRTVNVEMMPTVCAKLDGRVPHVVKSLARRTAKPTEESATKETASVLLVLLVFNVKPRLMSALTVAQETVSVTSGANNATAMMDSLETIVQFVHALTAATNQMDDASMEHATVHQIIAEKIAQKRIVQMPALVMVAAIAMITAATANQDGLDMIAA